MKLGRARGPLKAAVSPAGESWSLEVQIHPSDIRKRVRYLFLSRAQLTAWSMLALLYLLVLALAAAVAPGVIGALMTALGFTNVSGMLLSDWWNLSAAQNLPIEQAAKVFGGFKDSSLLFLWNGFEMFSLVGTILLLVGLARAGVLAWWSLAVFVAGFAGLMFVPWDMPKVSTLAVLVGFAPFAVIGARLLQRAGIGRR